jgi:hypothetical protein
VKIDGPAVAAMTVTKKLLEHGPLGAMLPWSDRALVRIRNRTEIISLWSVSRQQTDPASLKVDVIDELMGRFP